MQPSPLKLAITLALISLATPIQAEQNPVEPLATANAQPRASDKVLATKGTAGTVQTQLDTVLVTGTRVDNNTLKDSATPITVLTARDLTNSGQANLLQALQTLLPSLNLPDNIQPDLGSIVRGAQLRNLSPAYTLVLINGVRRGTSAAYTGAYPGDVYVDLSLIPMSAIDHIEVLRDGASALYGADAVAGVINIILKKDAEGGQVSVEGGNSYNGDGSRGILRANGGFHFGRAGWVNLSLETTHQNIAITSPALNSSYLFYPAVNDSTGALQALGKNNSLPAGASANPAEAGRNSRAWINQGIFPYSQQSFAVNAGYDFSKALQVYGFATYSHRNAETPENYRLPNTIFISNPSALSLYPDGFTPWEVAHETDYQISGGARGEIDDWKWNFSSTYNSDGIDTYTDHSLNYSLDYPGGPTNFYDGFLGYNQLNSNLDLRRAFDLSFLPRPLELSFGLEYEHDQYKYLPGEWASYYGSGAASEVGNKPVDEARTTRQNIAAYAGLATHLTERWELDLAARFQHYSDFGGVPNGSIATRFNFTRHFALRGSLSNGFKAPSLVAESYTNTNDRNGATYAVVRPGSAIGQALGATPLQAEKAHNYSVGLVWDPENWLDITVDAYQIDVRNQIGVSPTVGLNTTTGEDANGHALTASQVAQITRRLESFGVDPIILKSGYFVNYFTNIGSVRTRGVDLNISASQDSPGWGHFRYTLAANFNTNRLTSQAALPAALQEFPNISLLTQSSLNSLLYLSPKRKLIGNINWYRHSWHANLKETYYGPLRRISTQTYYLNPRFVTDLSIGKDLGHGLSIDLGANNLFSQKPGKIPNWARSTGSLAQYPYVYDQSSPVSTVGGYYYGRVTYTF